MPLPPSRMSRSLDCSKGTVEVQRFREHIEDVSMAAPKGSGQWVWPPLVVMQGGLTNLSEEAFTLRGMYCSLSLPAADYCTAGGT